MTCVVQFRKTACWTKKNGFQDHSGSRRKRWERCRSPVSRILSPSCEDGRSFLSPRRSGAPRLRGVRLLPGVSNGRAALPLFCLAPREVCRAVRLPGFAVGSYSTISPLPVPLRAIGGIFLLHCLSGFLAVPVPHFHEARCPVVSGLSSPPARAETATVRGAARARCACSSSFPRKRSQQYLRGEGTDRF